MFTITLQLNSNQNVFSPILDHVWFAFCIPLERFTLIDMQRGCIVNILQLPPEQENRRYLSMVTPVLVTVHGVSPHIRKSTTNLLLCCWDRKGNLPRVDRDSNWNQTKIPTLAQCIQNINFEKSFGWSSILKFGVWFWVLSMGCCFSVNLSVSG